MTYLMKWLSSTFDRFKRKTIKSTGTESHDYLGACFAFPISSLTNHVLALPLWQINRIVKKYTDNIRRWVAVLRDSILQSYEMPINNKSVPSIMEPFLSAKKLKLALVQGKFGRGGAMVCCCWKFSVNFSFHRWIINSFLLWCSPYSMGAKSDWFANLQGHCWQLFTYIKLLVFYACINDLWFLSTFIRYLGTWPYIISRHNVMCLVTGFLVDWPTKTQRKLFYVRKVPRGCSNVHLGRAYIYKWNIQPNTFCARPCPLLVRLYSSEKRMKRKIVSLDACT